MEFFNTIGRLLPVTTVSFLAGYLTPRPAANGTLATKKRIANFYLNRPAKFLAQKVNGAT